MTLIESVGNSPAPYEVGGLFLGNGMGIKTDDIPYALAVRFGFKLPQIFEQIAGKLPLGVREETFLEAYQYAGLNPARKRIMDRVFSPNFQEPGYIIYTGFIPDNFNTYWGSFLSQKFLRTLLPEASKGNDGLSHFLTGLILSTTPYEDIPDEVRERLGVKQTSKSFKVAVSASLTNCSTSENLFDHCLDTRRLVLVNGFLLVKEEGYKTGLCIQTTATSGGTFYRGSWYTPHDTETKKTVRDTLASDCPRVEVQEGTWIYIRDTSKYLSADQRKQLLQKAQRYAHSF